MPHTCILGANWHHRMADLSEWMAENGGRVCEAARALGWDYDTTKQVWRRVRKRMGPQAQ